MTPSQSVRVCVGDEYRHFQAETRYLGINHLRQELDRYLVRLPGLSVALEGSHKSVDGRQPIKVAISPRSLRELDADDRQSVLDWLAAQGFITSTTAEKYARKPGHEQETNHDD